MKTSTSYSSWMETLWTPRMSYLLLQQSMLSVEPYGYATAEVHIHAHSTREAIMQNCT